MSGSWANKRVLLLGARGMLGVELTARLGDSCASAGGELIAWDLAELDIAERGAVQDAIREVAPQVVVNAAAYTDVDGCEAEVEQAAAVNGRAPGYLAEACAVAGAMLVHFSTDFVFDGMDRVPYLEDDPVQPMSVYGRTKWEGEQAIRQHGPRHLIVRTSWLFGLGGRNFVEAILGRAEAGEDLRVVNDQTGRPTFAVDLADAVIRLLDAGAEGTAHFANEGACTWHGFASAIVQQAGLDVAVEAISTETLGRPARRPPYSVLDTQGYTRVTGAAPPPWQDALTRYLQARRQRREATGGV